MPATQTPLCKGTRVLTNFRDAVATCPVCHRVKGTLTNGRIKPHFAPAPCAALVYHKGWPDTCSRTAIEGSRYCRQHAAVK